MCEPFAIFPRRMLRAGLSHREQSVLLCLLSYKNNDGEAWPSRATIATDTGLHISNVHKAVKSLAQKGVIAMNTQSGVRTVYTFPFLDHTAQNLDMVDHAPVIAKSATTDADEGRGQNVTPLATPDAGQTVPKTVTIEKPPTADNPSHVEQSGNSGMLPEPPASVPPEVKAAPLPAIVMAENAKPNNVTDAFMQELNARPIVQPKPVDDDLMARAKRLAALQAENSARSRAEKLAERGLLNAGESGQDDAAPALATATPATPATSADNLPPVAKTEEQAVKTEELPAKHEELEAKTEELPVKTKELAATVESIAQPAPDAAAPIILPATVVVHETQDSAPQSALQVIDAPQAITPQQGELLPAPVTAGQGELQPVKSKRCKSVAVQGELLPMETKKRATRLPEDWQLPRSWGIWAMEEYGFTEDEVRYHARQFALHWWSSGKSNAYKVNWYMAWQKWIGKEHKDKERLESLYQQKSKVTQAVEILEQGKGKCRMDNQYEWNPFYVPTPEEKEMLRRRGEKPANEQNLIDFDSAKKYGTF